MKTATAEALDLGRAGVDAAPAPGPIVFRRQLFRVRAGRSWALVDDPPLPPHEPVRRPAKVAQLLAFAHAIEAAIARGDYRDRAAVARELGLTRARITQITDLTLLAPDLQERVLEMEAVDGVEPTSERGLRKVVARAGWREQRLPSCLLRGRTSTAIRGELRRAI